MRTIVTVHLVPAVLQVVVPLLLLRWQLRRESSRLPWLAKTAAVALYLVAILLAGLWLVLPWYTPLLYLVMFAIIATRGPWPAAWRPARSRDWAIATAATVLAVAAAVLIVAIVAARRPPQGALPDLQFPLGPGTYQIVSGGSSELINPHLALLRMPQAHEYRGQSYGVDIVQLGPFGLRAAGLAPREPARYLIFGRPVIAPCPGMVIAAEDGNPDMPPPRHDRMHMAGNYVFLACDGLQVLLGHLRNGSVHVRAGDEVEAGDVLGEVGNSGNTDEPHLHIHVQRPAEPGTFRLAGAPVPMTFNGRYPVRNARIAVE